MKIGIQYNTIFYSVNQNMILINILYLNYDIESFKRNAKVINKFKRSSVDTIFAHCQCNFIFTKREKILTRKKIESLIEHLRDDESYRRTQTIYTVS